MTTDPSVPRRAAGLALLALLAACGQRGPGVAASSLLTSAPPPQRPAPAPVPPGPAPETPAELANRVVEAYRALDTLTATIDMRQRKGSETGFARMRLTFAKPRRERVVFEKSSSKLLEGVTIVWFGGPNLKGMRRIGPFPVATERAVDEDRDLRGWSFDQTDFHRIATSAARGIPGGRILGRSAVKGEEVILVEYRATLPGVAIERVGISARRFLPVYWELREGPTGLPAHLSRYEDVSIGSPVPPDTFRL